MENLYGSVAVLLCLFYGLKINVFIEFLTVQRSGFLMLVSSLGLLTFCLFVFPKFVRIVFILSPYILSSLI